jgi:hypothetical protein
MQDYTFTTLSSQFTKIEKVDVKIIKLFFGFYLIFIIFK